MDAARAMTVKAVTPEASAVAPTASGPVRPGGALRRFRAFFGRHPVLLLLLFSPGIPEYLSGSTRLNFMVESPVVFALFLGANLALYGPGVLLVREAMVRWRKGWASVLVLGAAYGILEEGVALSTLFNPRAGVVGALGFYGHFAGVSWVWLVGVLMFHVVYSISLPILLLELAIPATKGRSLLGRGGIGVALGVLALDVILLAELVNRSLGFWMGLPLLAASLAAIGGLVLLAWRLPAGAGVPRHPVPSAPPLVFGALGAGTFFAVVLVQSLNDSLGTPAVLGVAELVGLLAVVGLLLRELLGRQGNERALLAFAAGAIADVAVFGVAEGLPVPLVGVADVLAVLFFVHLFRSYPAPVRPAGAAAPAPAGWSA